MRSTAKVLVQICLVLLVWITFGYASEDKARSLKVISEFTHAGARSAPITPCLWGSMTTKTRKSRIEGPG